MSPLDELKMKNAGLTVSRMVESYKRAVDPKEHITILADQTLIEPEHIVEILKEAGCKVEKWHKRWTPGVKRESVEALEKIHEASQISHKHNIESQEREHKEVRNVEEKKKRAYHRKPKQESKTAVAQEEVIDGTELTSPGEGATLIIQRDGMEPLILHPEEVSWREPVPSWLYDLAETEYQLTKNRLEPYLKDIERMKSIEEWMSTHEAV